MKMHRLVVSFVLFVTAVTLASAFSLNQKPSDSRLIQGVVENQRWGHHGGGRHGCVDGSHRTTDFNFFCSRTRAWITLITEVYNGTSSNYTEPCMMTEFLEAICPEPMVGPMRHGHGGHEWGKPHEDHHKPQEEEDGLKTFCMRTKGFFELKGMNDTEGNGAMSNETDSSMDRLFLSFVHAICSDDEEMREDMDSEMGDNDDDENRHHGGWWYRPEPADPMDKFCEKTNKWVMTIKTEGNITSYNFTEVGIELMFISFLSTVCEYYDGDMRDQNRRGGHGGHWGGWGDHGQGGGEWGDHGHGGGELETPKVCLGKFCEGTNRWLVMVDLALANMTVPMNDTSSMNDTTSMNSTDITMEGAFIFFLRFICEDQEQPIMLN